MASLPEDALKNAGILVKHGNADAVKLEGEREREKAVKLMIESGIAVMGHIGLTPTYIHQFGGSSSRKNRPSRGKSNRRCKNIGRGSVFAIVLETIPWKIAKEITDRVHVPTIGIGAGPYRDGHCISFL